MNQWVHHMWNEKRLQWLDSQHELQATLNQKQTGLNKMENDTDDNHNQDEKVLWSELLQSDVSMSTEPSP